MEVQWRRDIPLGSFGRGKSICGAYVSEQARRAHRERVIEQLSEAMRPLQEKMRRDHEEYMERLMSGFTIKQIRDQITAKGGK